jgi:tetratricopeptide (TPR) repeat protein
VQAIVVREEHMIRPLWAFLALTVLVSTVCADVIDLLKSALAARNRGDMDAAIHYYTQAIETRNLSPIDLAVVLNSRGVAYDLKGEARKAISDFDAAIQLRPRFAEAFINRGLAWARTADYDRAIADFSEATKLDSKNAHLALSNRANAYSEMGDLKQAIRDFDEALRLSPEYAGAYYGRANAYRAQGDYERAVADYGQAIRLVPMFADAYINRGAAHQQIGAIEKAIDDFSAAIRIRPTEAVALANRGNAYAMMGDYERAIADLDKAMRIRPNNALFALQRGRAQFYAGQTPIAADDFAMAVRLQPSSAYATIWLHIARARMGQDDRQELTANARPIDRMRWPGPLVDLYLGSRELSDLLASVDAIRSAADQRKQVCDAEFYGAEFLFEKGNRIDAQRLWRQAASDCPPGTGEQSAAQLEVNRSVDAPANR